MGTGYTRNDTSNNIADGNVVNASDLDGEFDAVESAFSTSGHTHDGTAAEGGPVTVVGPAQDVVVSGTNVNPKTTNTLDLGTASLKYKDAYLQGNITVDGTVDGRDVATDGAKLDGIEPSATADQTDAEIRAAVEAATDSNVFTDADHTKLNGIEASADVTDTTNVTAAGALMDSEVTNLAQVKAFNSADYATAAQGTTADNALPKAGGTMTGNIVMSGSQTVDGRDLSVDGTKLDGIATSATANPNAIDNVVEDTTPQLGGDLASNGNDILFADNDRAVFGAGSDLQIYHTGLYSFISDQGTGGLYIDTNGSEIALRSNTGSENMLLCQQDGAVTAYHNNAAKLATTATGVSVTGSLAVTDAATTRTNIDVDQAGTALALAIALG